MNYNLRVGTILHRISPAVWSMTAVLASLLSTGCNDGTVEVTGRVMLEGHPARGGQLLLTPATESAAPAAAYVDDAGRFVLHTSGRPGVSPGQYHALYRYDIDDEARESIPPHIARKITSDAITISYRSPSDQPITITPNEKEALELAIGESAGWIANLSD